MLYMVLEQTSSGKPLEVLYTFPEYYGEDMVTNKTKREWMDRAGGEEGMARYKYRQAHRDRRMLLGKGERDAGIRKYTPDVWDACLDELDVFEVALSLIDMWRLSTEGSDEQKTSIRVLYEQYGYIFRSKTLEKAEKEMYGIARCRGVDIRYAIENGLKLLSRYNYAGVARGSERSGSERSGSEGRGRGEQDKSKVFRVRNELGVDLALLNGIDED